MVSNNIASFYHHRKRLDIWIDGNIPINMEKDQNDT